MTEVPNIPRQKGTWPIVFGIVAIILGLLGAAFSSMKTFQFAALKSGHVTATGNFSVAVDGKETIDEDIGAEMLELMKKSATSNFWTGVCLTLLAVLLFISGIFLLVQLRIARMLLLVWAFLKMIAGPFSAYLQTNTTRSMMSVMDDQFALGNAEKYLSFAFTGMMILNMLWMILFPIILLIWLNREVIKDDIATGYGWH